jgi:hypothetical protein
LFHLSNDDVSEKTQYVTTLENLHLRPATQDFPSEHETTVPAFGNGFAMPLSLPRIWVGDMLDSSKGIPSIPVERQFHLKKLCDLRNRNTPKIRWISLFLKAYSVVCREFPELRRSYLSRPYHRLWQHDRNVASIAISRPWNEHEHAIFFARIRNPEYLTLKEIDDTITYYQTTPIEKIGSFQRQIRLAKLPRLIRKLIWKFGLNWSGIRKERYFGTFGVSVYSSNGANSLHPLSPLTTLLNYGPINEQGQVLVRIVYDHRVMDGMIVGQALAKLEEVLNTQLARELHSFEVVTDIKQGVDFSQKKAA